MVPEATYPARRGVTVTVIRLSSWSAPSARVQRVAPAIGCPSAYHCTAVEVGWGVQVPEVAVSVAPTLAIPSIVGTVFVVNVPGCTTSLCARARLGR